MSKFLQGQTISSVSGQVYNVLREETDAVDFETGEHFYKLKDIDGDIVTLSSEFVNETFKLI